MLFRARGSSVNLTRRQALALVAHDVRGLSDGAIAADCGVGRTAITMRRARGLANLTDAQRAAYRRAFPPRLGRPGKRRPRTNKRTT